MRDTEPQPAVLRALPPLNARLQKHAARHSKSLILRRSNEEAPVTHPASPTAASYRHV